MSSRKTLHEILRLEEQGNWEAVEAVSLELILAIKEGRSEDVPNNIYRYVDDFDIRRKDECYAEGQRKAVIAYLSSQEF